MSRDFAGAAATIQFLPWKLEKRVPYECFIQESPATDRALQSKRKGGSIYDQVLVKVVHVLFGRITVQIFWTRKRHK
ncbi:MAG: hypothetical protein WDO73_29820 [Ignavibacteriota bacterium]